MTDRHPTNLIWNLFDSVLSDLDGVVYEGSNAIEPAPRVLAELAANRIPVAFVTNNSSRRSEVIAEQLAGFGIVSEPDDIIGSGQIGVELLSTLVPSGSRVLVVGGEGLRYWVQKAGFEVVSDASSHPAAVIQGFAPDVAWRNLAEAAYAIQAGAKWVATNSDWTLPQERGLAPGNGTLVSAVHTAVGQLPIVAGKPEVPIFEASRKHLEAKYSATRPLFIGDRIDTDITGANKAGLASALVMTGVSTRKEVLGQKPEGRPRYIIKDLAELAEPYRYPIETKHGYRCGESLVEISRNKVRVIEGAPKSIDALKAACAVIYTSKTPIYGLDVEPALYED